MKLGALAFPALSLLAACSALFDTASQCSRDADCAGFNGAVCDTSQGICVARSSLPDAATPDDTALPNDAGATNTDPRCALPNKPVADVVAKSVDAGASEITGAVTLDCTTDWVLHGRVFLRAGASLTIQPNTTVRVEGGALAGLVVAPGAHVVAAGLRDAPIVFTSASATPAPGNWHGLVVLGSAPTHDAGPFDADPALAYGGSNVDDSSGDFEFVRVEYGTYGVVFAGVGRKTKIDSIEVRMLSDNAFTFFGGNAEAKHLVTQFPGDEYLEYGDGYAGRLQFFFGQKAAHSDEHHGVLTDDSFPVLFNLTLCGDSQVDQNYGLVVRNGSKLDMNDAILTNWFGGVDMRDGVSSPVELEGSIAFGNAANPAYAEDPSVTNTTSPLFDDDNGFDEIAWFEAPTRNNSQADPGLISCFDPKSPAPYATSTLTTGATPPPNDGFFDSSATFIGAFRGPSDTWMTGSWLRFDDH